MLTVSGPISFFGTGMTVYTVNYVIPANSIILSNVNYTGAIAGWERYAPAANNLIVGTADQANVGVYFTSTGSTTATSGTSIGTSGSHYGSGTYTSGGGAYYSPQSPYGYGGDHSHSSTFSLTANTSSLNMRPIHTKFVFLKTPTDTQMFPPGAIHISETSLYTGAVQQTANASPRYVVGGYSARSDSNAISHSFTFKTADGPSNHGHSTSQADTGGSRLYGALRTIGSYYYYEPVLHYHTVTRSATLSKLKGKLLNLWHTASAQFPQNTTIIMYDGVLSALPSYWKVCDGTNGTVDMRNYFLGYANTSAISHATITASNTEYNIIDPVVTTTETWGHSHYLGTSSTYNDIQMRDHSNQNALHNHSVSGGTITTNYEPDHLKLAFIQFMPGTV